MDEFPRAVLLSLGQSWEVLSIWGRTECQGFSSKGSRVSCVSCGFRVRLADPGRYAIRVGRSTSVNGPFQDKDGKNLTDGGGTVVYASNHGVVYAPGGVGVLPANEKHPEILYYHYRESIPTLCVWFTDSTVNTSMGLKDNVSRITTKQ